MGLVGGVVSVATIGGPLLGGVVTDAFGWRANFFIGVPFAVAAIIIIQRTLNLPRADRTTNIDFVGAALLALEVSLLLIWVSMGGNQFEWNSFQSCLIIGVSAAALIGFVVTELTVREPIVPMTLFKNRTFTLAVIPSVAVGVALFSTSVFLAQHFQLARGANATQSGLMTIPLVVGQLVASILIGQRISKYGAWKRWMVIGSVFLLVDVSLMSTLRYNTDFVWVSVFIVILGAGLGIVMQNLTLVVQNGTPADQLGAASSNVSFFRSVGGSVGVTVMGSILASQVTSHITSSLSGFVPKSADEVAALKTLSTGNLPNISALPQTIRVIVESAYGNGIGDAFLVAIPLAVVSLIAVIFLPNKALSTQTALQELARQGEESAIDLAGAGVESPLTGSVALVNAGRSVRTRDCGDQ